MADSQGYATPLSASRTPPMSASRMAATPPLPATPVSTSFVMAPRATLQSLPPYKRAQILLQEMAGITARLLEIAGNKPWQSGHHKSTFPLFLPGASVPPEAMSATNTKDGLAILDSLQSLLNETMLEISELQALEQEKQRIAEAVAAKDAAIRDFAKRVRDAEQVLESTLEEFEEFRRPAKEAGTLDGFDIGLGTINVAELISYAHKISYSTFAPPDFLPGQPIALAPAPQEQQMRASQLYHFSDMDLGLLKPPAAAETTAAAPSPAVAATKESPAAAAAGVLPPPAVGLPPGIKLPPMPAGWKPGDPVPLPEQGIAPQPPAPGAAGVIHVPFVQLDLNPELEDDYATDYSDEEESSAEED